MNRIIRRISILFVLAFLSISGYGQSFEGWIVYKAEVLNPSPMIPDSLWKEMIKEQLGERGYIVQKYYYKKGNYMSSIDAGKEKGFQVFNPKDKLLYSWQSGSDTAVTVSSTESPDQIVKIIDSEQRDTIMGIPCKCVILKLEMGEITLWYNSAYLKMDASYYKGHIYGHWEEILKKIGCLPLKIEQKGPMAHYVQTATQYKEVAVNDKQFEIPEFKVILEN